MTSLAKTPKELCRVKKAVKELIKQNPNGMTHSEICKRLQQQSLFLGTYRNLISQASSALRLLIEEGVIVSKGSVALKKFFIRVKETQYEGGLKMPEGKVKWFNDKRDLVLSSRTVARTYSYIIPRYREKVLNRWRG